MTSNGSSCSYDSYFALPGKYMHARMHALQAHSVHEFLSRPSCSLAPGCNKAIVFISSYMNVITTTHSPVWTNAKRNILCRLDIVCLLVSIHYTTDYLPGILGGGGGGGGYAPSLVSIVCTFNRVGGSSRGIM